MIAIIDYDAGNIKSVEKAVNKLGYECVITRDIDLLKKADKLILPGVGAFEDAMGKLNEYGLTEVIRELVLEEKKPFMGICLGLQLIFDSSEEGVGVKGLSLVPGKIVRLPEGDNRKIPHMGWNSLHFPKESTLFKGVDEGSYVYFVHSYYLQADDENVVAATSEYGATIHAAIETGNIYATQFHPEKSSTVGLKILNNFLEA
ncbi:MAG: imidazole glycerol phosphate synthase subunit HisH [Lachnospiraceae bacterium]|nr:imidazole glycerol phosphate synthase subunit HisH [Lachnospiraceae bacterium]